MSRAWFAALAVLAAALLPAQPPQDPPAGAAPAVQNPFQPFDRARFEAAARELGATAEQLQAFAKAIDEFGLARAADDLVRRAVPAFDAAVQRHEASDPAAALALAKVLADAAPPLLQAHARYHLARVFLDSDDPERAVEVLAAYIRQSANLSPLDGEAAFFYAQALAEIPMPQEALPRYRAFLQWFPEASERFRSAAHQRIGELERQQGNDLHTLADGMKKTTRDLKKQRTGKPTQLDQEGYLKELDRLIEMYEEMEKQSSGAPSGNGPSSNPASNSALPEGESAVGNLQKRPSLADRWGDMKDRDREKIETEVQKGLPPQYRKMLEEYYKKLGRQGNQ